MQRFGRRLEQFHCRWHGAGFAGSESVAIDMTWLVWLTTHKGDAVSATMWRSVGVMVGTNELIFQHLSSLDGTTTDTYHS